MSQAQSHRRPSLEPLAPAFIGVAMAHGFAAFFLWMFIAAWAPTKKSLPLPPDITWHSPADYLRLQPDTVPAITKAPEQLPRTPPPITPPTKTPATPVVSAKMLTEISRQASTLVMPAVELMPKVTDLTINPPVSQSVKPDQTNEPREQVPAIEPASIIGPEANKYITISPVDQSETGAAPPVVKPVLSLLDIANLNEAQKKRWEAEGGANMEPVQSALEKAILKAWKSPTIKAVPLNQRRVTLTLSVLRDGSVEDMVVTTPSGSDLLDASVRAAIARVTKIAETLPSSFPKDRYSLQVNFQIE